jgi:hypothetical protein
MKPDNEEFKFFDDEEREYQGFLESPLAGNNIPNKLCCVFFKYGNKYIDLNLLDNGHKYVSLPVNFCTICGRKRTESFEDEESRYRGLTGSIFVEGNIPNKACCDFIKRSAKYIKYIYAGSDHVFLPINFCPVCGEKRTEWKE